MGQVQCLSVASWPATQPSADAAACKLSIILLVSSSVNYYIHVGIYIYICIYGAPAPNVDLFCLSSSVIPPTSLSAKGKRLSRTLSKRKGLGPKPFKPFKPVEPFELFEPSLRWNPGGGGGFHLREGLNGLNGFGQNPGGGGFL